MSVKELIAGSSGAAGVGARSPVQNCRALNRGWLYSTDREGVICYYASLHFRQGSSEFQACRLKKCKGVMLWRAGRARHQARLSLQKPRIRFL